jgi:hypothetical protein
MYLNSYCIKMYVILLEKHVTKVCNNIIGSKCYCDNFNIYRPRHEFELVRALSKIGVLLLVSSNPRHERVSPSSVAIVPEYVLAAFNWSFSLQGKSHDATAIVYANQSICSSRVCMVRQITDFIVITVFDIPPRIDWCQTDILGP